MFDTARHSQLVDEVFALAPVIPVLAIDRIEDALPLCRALVDNGLPVLEITLRTACALDAIALVARELPHACVGAGTVLSATDLAKVTEAEYFHAATAADLKKVYETLSSRLTVEKKETEISALLALAGAALALLAAALSVWWYGRVM